MVEIVKQTKILVWKEETSTFSNSHSKKND